MAAYLITSLKVSDPQKYQQYTALTPAAFAGSGGRMLARGPAQLLEGRWPDARMVLLEFPSAEAARAFYESPAYQRARAAREGATEFFDTILVPGVE